MKKILALLLVIAMTLCICACGNDSGEIKTEDVETENDVKTEEQNKEKEEDVEEKEAEIDEDTKVLLDELSKEAAALPNPSEITSPEVFIDNFEKYADLYSRCRELDAKYIKNTKVFEVTFPISSKLNEWTSKSELGNKYENPQSAVGFWERYKACISKMKEASEKASEAYSK